MKKLVVVVLHAVLCAFSEEISEELQGKIREAICEARCLDKNFRDGLCIIPKCSCPADTLPTKPADSSKTYETGPLTEPVLLCKDESHLGFKWERRQPLVFLLEYKTKNSPWKFLNKTCNSAFLMEKRIPNTYYQIRVWATSPTGKIYGPRNSTTIRTNPVGFTPAPVLDINVTEKVIGHSSIALVKWKPAKDRACFYDFTWYESEGQLDYWQNDVRDIQDLFQIEIPNLHMQKNYTIHVMSKSGDMKRESAKTITYFTTPNCLEIYENLTRCPPAKPKLIRVEEKIVESTASENITYDITVGWAKQNLTPDYYVVSIYVLMINASAISKTVPGNETTAKFFNVHVGAHYQVGLVATSKGGSSKMDLVDKQIKIDRQMLSTMTSWAGSTHIPIILGSLGGVVALGVILFIILYRRFALRAAKRQTDSMISKYYSEGFTEKCPPSINNMTMEYYLPDIADDEWQLDSEQLVLGDVLGEGAFGVVRKGYLKMNNECEMEVAVKMLKGNPNTEEMKQFESEIEIMKSVGSHPHLVSLKGCGSKMGYLGPFLVVEYCAKGDLQTFLRAVWEQLSSQTPETGYVNATSEDIKPDNHFSNKVYEIFDDSFLEPRDLLSFARQIILGMEYLSNLRVVHRDLAARNVLMCNNRTVKVADFGLSRDVYQDNIYTKTGSGKVPVKWMALESLSHQQYTTQSDVWSFGIVLWEIVTLGGHPYSTIPAKDLLGLLKSGYRMECPKNCSAELYEIMMMCWRDNPKERPTFSDLRIVLEKLLETENRYISLDVRY